MRIDNGISFKKILFFVSSISTIKQNGFSQNWGAFIISHTSQKLSESMVFVAVDIEQLSLTSFNKIRDTQKYTRYINIAMWKS